MQIVEVRDDVDRKAFLHLPCILYNSPTNWIRPLDKDIEAVFDPKKNKFFRHGESIRWILKNNKEVIGRVAAFMNRRTATKGSDQPTGGIGFFECIQDQEASFALFDTCKKWLSERKMEAMDGPVNFGTRDNWWGLLVDGFDIDPNYRCNYNLPYYQELFETYGFRTYFKQFTYGRRIADPLSKRLIEKANLISNDPNYHFEHLRIRNLDKYIDDFRIIYNAAWASHAGVNMMTPSQAKAIFYQMKPLLDEKIIWFGYYKNEPIACFIMIPEVNQIFKYVNGKMNLLGKSKFLYHRWRQTCIKVLGVVFGIVPAHQGKGVDGAIIMAAREMVQEKYLRYEFLEMNWIGDFNPKMIRVVEQVGGDIVKTHITYRKLFDENKPFKRMPFR